MNKLQVINAESSIRTSGRDEFFENHTIRDVNYKNLRFIFAACAKERP